MIRRQNEVHESHSIATDCITGGVLFNEGGGEELELELDV